MKGIHGNCLSCTQFCRGFFEIPRNFVVFNAENELIETEKSLQKDGHRELDRSGGLSSDEIPNFQRPEK